MDSESGPPPPQEFAPGVFGVGGPELTDPRDCLVCLVVGQGAVVLIDAGAGPGAAALVKNARRAAGQDPSHLFLTHAHIDHAGGAAEIKALTGRRVLIHSREAEGHFGLISPAGRVRSFILDQLDSLGFSPSHPGQGDSPHG